MVKECKPRMLCCSSGFGHFSMRMFEKRSVTFKNNRPLFFLPFRRERKWLEKGRFLFQDHVFMTTPICAWGFNCCNPFSMPGNLFSLFGTVTEAHAKWIRLPVGLLATQQINGGRSMPQRAPTSIMHA